LPGLDTATGQRLRAVRDGAIVVDRDDAPEAFAGGTGADGMIEAEKGRRGLAIIQVTVGTMESGGERPGLTEQSWGMEIEEGELAFAEMVGLFARFDEPRALGLVDFQAVLDHGECTRRLPQSGMAARLVEAHDVRARNQPLVALFGDEREGFFE